MNKTITMFKNIKDLNSFLNFYLNEILPILHTLPGILYSDMIKTEQISPEVPEQITGIQVIIETYFESKEALVHMLESEIGMLVMKKIEQARLDCEQYVYFGQIKRIPAKSSED